MDKQDVSKIFHDLKQPLVALSGYLQLLEIDLAEIDHNIEYIDPLMKSLSELSKSIEVARNEIQKNMA